MHTRTLILFLVAILVAGGAVFAIDRFTPIFGHRSPQAVSGVDVLNTARATNPSFQAGMQAYAAGDYVTAIAQYRTALTSADHASAASINLQLASALTRTGSYEEAIAIYKNIAADYTYAPSLRASAIQWMGVMYEYYTDPSITTAIFSSEPYSELYSASSTSYSYRRLYEYAASIYPLSLSELRAASWYANQLISPTEQLKNDASLRARYKETIATDIAAADRFLTSSGAGPLYTNYLDSFRERAVLLGKLARLGDTSQGDPEEAFQKVINLYAQNNKASQDGMARIGYAVYLTHAYGKSRAQDIHQILTPLTSVPPISQVPDSFWISSEKKGSSYRKVFAEIASIDRAFKMLLLAHGWTEADF